MPDDLPASPRHRVTASFSQLPGRGPSPPSPDAHRGERSTAAVHNPAAVPAPRRLEPDSDSKDETGWSGQQVELNALLVQSRQKLQHHVTVENGERLDFLQRHWELGTFARTDLNDSAKIMLLALAMSERLDDAGRVMLVTRSMRRVFPQGGRNRSSGYEGLNQLLERGLVKLHVTTSGRIYELPMPASVAPGSWQSGQSDEEQGVLFGLSGQPDSAAAALGLYVREKARAQPEKSGQPDGPARAQPEKSDQPDASAPPSHSPRVVDVVVFKNARSKTTTTNKGECEGVESNEVAAGARTKGATGALAREPGNDNTLAGSYQHGPGASATSSVQNFEADERATLLIAEKIGGAGLVTLLGNPRVTVPRIREAIVAADRFEARGKKFREDRQSYIFAFLVGGWTRYVSDQQRREAQVPPAPAGVPMKSFVADAAADARRKLKALPTQELRRRIGSDPELSRFANAAENLDALAALPDWAALRLWTCGKEQS